jgi:hypothetical protein
MDRHSIETLRRWQSLQRIVTVFFVSKKLPLVISFKGNVTEVHDDFRVKLSSRDGYTAVSLTSAIVMEPSVRGLPPDARKLIEELLEAVPSSQSEPLLLLFPDESLLLMRAD